MADLVDKFGENKRFVLENFNIYKCLLIEKIIVELIKNK